MCGVLCQDQSSQLIQIYKDIGYLNVKFNINSIMRTKVVIAKLRCPSLAK